MEEEARRFVMPLPNTTFVIMEGTGDANDTFRLCQMCLDFTNKFFSLNVPYALVTTDTPGT